MKKIINNIKRLGLSVKKEFVIFGIVNFILIGCSICFGIFMKMGVFFAFGPGFAVVFSILYLSRYGTLISKINSDNLIEFSELFGFFRIYVKNGYNVYNALKEISKFANKNLKELLEKLLTEIDGNKTVQPFINFSSNFDEIIVEELMISIYQMIDEGEQSNYLSQFELIFDKFSEALIQKELKKKDSKLGTLSSTPLIGSSFLIIVITIGIIGLIGDIINGI